MLEILIASRNAGKVKEIKEILKDIKVKWLTLDDFPGIPEVEEDGETFEENAFKKADKISQYTGKICLADDSGLEIDCLKGEPGIYSSRWGTSDEERIHKVLELMKNVPKNQRSAKFICVLVLAYPEGRRYIIKEECKGIIAEQPRGEYGFGYDPIFLVPEYDKTFAELGERVKNEISHRGKALQKMAKIINELVTGE